MLTTSILESTPSSPSTNRSPALATASRSVNHAAESSEDAARLRIAIASSFTAEPLEDSLQFWIDWFGWPYQIAFGPFDQVFQQLLSADSVFAENQGGVNLVLLRLDAWLPDG